MVLRQLEGLSAPFPGHLPVALLSASSESEKVSFNEINKSTGHRIKYLKVDTDTYVTVDKDELDNIALETRAPSTSTNSSRSPTSKSSISCGRITSSPRARLAMTPLR